MTSNRVISNEPMGSPGCTVACSGAAMRVNSQSASRGIDLACIELVGRSVRRCSNVVYAIVGGLGCVIRRRPTANRERIDIPPGGVGACVAPGPASQRVTRLLRTSVRFCEVGLDFRGVRPGGPHHRGLPRFALTSSPRTGLPALPHEERT